MTLVRPTIRDLETRCPEDTKCSNCVEDKYCSVINPSWSQLYEDIVDNPDKYWK